MGNTYNIGECNHKNNNIITHVNMYQKMLIITYTAGGRAEKKLIILSHEQNNQDITSFRYQSTTKLLYPLMIRVACQNAHSRNKLTPTPSTSFLHNLCSSIHHDKFRATRKRNSSSLQHFDFTNEVPAQNVDQNLLHKLEIL